MSSKAAYLCTFARCEFSETKIRSGCLIYNSIDLSQVMTKVVAGDDFGRDMRV